MAMYKECGNVVSTNEIKNGICKTCIEDGVIAEPMVTPSNLEVVKVSNFGNPFSFRGRSGRLDYFLYGVLLAYGLIIFGTGISAKFGNIAAMIGFILVGGLVALAATVRRARDRKENIILVLILSIIPYLGFIVILFLLFAPGKRDEEFTGGDDEVDEQKVQPVYSTVE